jgi:putative FmdB family regulatory protein
VYQLAQGKTTHLARDFRPPFDADLGGRYNGLQADPKEGALPLYEYQCAQCGDRIEKIQKFSDPPLTKCQECGGPLERLLSTPAIQFKGSGWYVTDYARKSAPASETKTEGTSTSAEKKAAEPAKASEPSKT